MPLLLLLCSWPAQAADVRVSPILQVVDGDTIKLRSRNVRIIGYDAPEIFHYQCAAEKALGLQARSALVALLSPPHAVKVKLARNKHGKLSQDKYGRRLGKVYSDGTDVSPLMIQQGLAHPYMGYGARGGWCK